MKNLVKSAVSVFHMASAVLDKVCYSKISTLRWPPVFIIGVPRSGTTFLSQLLLANFEFAYFPNIANRFYMCPLYATRVTKLLLKPYNSKFRSKYGFESGAMAPSEAGNIWNRWFPHENREGYNYTPVDYLTRSQIQQCYHVVAHQESIFRAPFLNKNVKMSVRLPALQRIFPHVKLIFIERDPLQSALSILTRRRQLKKDWWSVQPREIEELKNYKELEQVAGQVYYTHQNIIDDSRQIGEESFLTVNFDALCQNPQEQLGLVEAFLKHAGIPTMKKNPGQIPAPYAPAVLQENQWVTKKDISDLGNSLERFQILNH